MTQEDLLKASPETLQCSRNKPANLRRTTRTEDIYCHLDQSQEKPESDHRERDQEENYWSNVENKITFLLIQTILKKAMQAHSHMYYTAHTGRGKEGGGAKMSNDVQRLCFIKSLQTD